MYRRAFLALAAAVSTAAAGCLEYVTDDDGEEITDPGDVEIVWHDLLRDDPGTEDERVAVWGAVRNVGNRTLSYIEIRATFFDAEGEQLESVIENVDADVTTGREWPFEVEYPHFGERAAEVESYELEPATGV
ncbi:FxLYD domain-containing protein [Halopiger goleimassiliensis]|uniref:FxLYD domain-containing protein n=1 Tax=Halopiger goleimassiliensis TaxID=1293048 RepID=UPI00067758BA|nr:FxLYD domain-containing protein [Halopiger goleimassiliensis]